MVTTREARRAAADWVRDELGALPELVGALLAGSARDRDPDAPHPASSDLDVWIVVDAAVPDPVREPGSRFSFRKLHYRGLIVERAFLPWERLADPARVLGDPHVAPALVAPLLLADPSGRLARLGAEVGAAFPHRSQVRRRVEGALALAEQFCGYSAAAAPPPGFHPLVASATVLAVAAAHAAAAPATAALVQPTTRRAFVLAGDVLRRHGRPELAEALLGALGSAGLGRPEAERALAELERAYAAAIEVRRTPFGLDYNVSPEARAFALAGVRELVAAHPREAMYQLVFLRGLAQNVIENDGSDEQREAFRAGLRALLSALGLDTEARRAARAAELRALLPRLRAGCEDVLAGTAGVVADGA